ncbi:MAG: CotH kinase family protein [Cyclobacteriaceae bacterium]
MRITSIILFLIPFISIAQLVQIDKSEIYDDTDLPRIDITIAATDLDFILNPDNAQSNEEFSATFNFDSDQLTATEENIGFRLRGNTSRSSEKKSFKVSFNSFEKGRDLKGFEKLNLNGEHNDPTMIRSKLCWDIMNDLGVPSSESNHVELYINGEYYGLYSNIEHIDEEFIERRFDNKDGNLYKCLWPADLKYKGSNSDDYKEEFSGRRAYELKINEDLDDYTGLANFISVLNQTPVSEFEEEIEKVFDVNSYLKALAVEVLVAHWDNHGINQNNFYLYDNPADGKFYYIPFDLDNTLGIDFFNEDWAEWDIYKWYNDQRPLPRKILQISKYREEFTRIIDGLLKNQFLPENMNEKIDALKNMIQDAAERDEFRTLDYGFTINEFNTSFSDALNYSHTRYGLKAFISRRHETAIAQLDEVVLLSRGDDRLEVKIYPNPTYQSININFQTTSTKNEVQIHSLDGKLVWHGVFDRSFAKIDHHLANGTYIINVVDLEDKKRFARKIQVVN